jgi:hypothetical protein
MQINCNGHIFYQDVPQSSPQIISGFNDIDFRANYIFVPTGIYRVYFFVRNGDIEDNRRFFFYTPDSTKVEPIYFTTDDYRYHVAYFDVPVGYGGSFWKLEYTGGVYGFSFINMQTKLLYLENL